MTTYLDILSKHGIVKVPESLPATDTGAVTPTAPVSTGVPVGGGSKGVERFRSMASSMQSAANASMTQEIERIVRMPISHEPTEEEIDLVSNWYFPDGAIRMFPEQVKAMIDFNEFGNLFAPVSVGRGKCVEGNTEIYDLNMGRVRVDQLGKFVIPSLTEKGKIVPKQADSFRSGVKQCVTLTLVSGQSIGLSWDHPVFTQRGWVKAGELLKTDLVATPRALPEPIKYASLTDAEVRIAAYLCSDGSTIGLTPSFSSPKDIMIEELRADLLSVGGSLTEQKQVSKAREFYIKGIRKYRGILFNRELSKHKRVPPEFYLLPKRQAALFLNRFIACDGHVNVSQRHIEVTLASEGLIDDLRNMLLRFGILTRKRYKQASYKKKGIRRFFDSWRLAISGQPNVLKFMENIGYPFTHEYASQQILDSISNQKHNTNTDIVPISYKEFREICDELGYPKTGGDLRLRRGRPRTELSRLLGVSRGQYISRDKMQLLIEKTGYSGKYAWLAYSDIAWEKIDSIQDRGLQPVFDLSVPDTHNFVGNGIILHNTLISTLCANDAYTVFGKQKILLLNPSHLVGQLRSLELPKYRKHGSINVPFFWLAQMTAKKRMMEAKSGQAGCYVLSYNNLSGKEGAEILLAIKPDMVIGDEIHRVLSTVSARGRRFREMLKIYSPSLVCLSGTMTQKSPKDYHLAATHALQERCFLPRPVSQNEEWSKIIDSNAEDADQYPQGQAPQAAGINKLVTWNNKNFPEKVTKDFVGVRDAFKRRMHTTPGVVASKGNSVGSSLCISNIPVSKDERQSRPGWDDLQKLINNLVNLWQAPNGDELEHAMHIWRYRYELEGIGGYNDLSWPSIEKIMKRRGVSKDEAEDLLERSQHHHRQHQEFSRQLRKWISTRAKTGLDTPMLIGSDMYRNGDKNVGPTLYQAWTTARDADFDGRIERIGSFVRVCDFRIRRIVEWAKHQHKKDPTNGCLIWYDNQGVGVWLAEAFKEAGLPYLHCQAGKEGLAKLTDDTKKDHFALATFNAFNEGLNIQKIHSRMLYAQWQRQAKILEQSIGRLHRPGQTADEVKVYGSFCLEFDWVLLAACLNDSAYVSQTISQQKLMIADWDFKPKIMPYAVLKELGAQPDAPTKESMQLLEDKFIEKD